MNSFILAALVITGGVSADFAGDLTQAQSAAGELESRVEAWSSPNGLLAALGIQGYFPTLSSAVAGLASDSNSLTNNDVDPSQINAFVASIVGLLNSLTEKANDFNAVGALSIVQNDLTDLADPATNIVNNIVSAIGSDCNKIPQLTAALNSISAGFSSANSAFGNSQLSFNSPATCPASTSSAAPTSTSAASTSAAPTSSSEPASTSSSAPASTSSSAPASTSSSAPASTSSSAPASTSSSAPASTSSPAPAPTSSSAAEESSIAAAPTTGSPSSSAVSSVGQESSTTSAPASSTPQESSSAGTPSSSPASQELSAAPSSSSTNGGVAVPPPAANTSTAAAAPSSSVATSVAIPSSTAPESSAATTDGFAVTNTSSSAPPLQGSTEGSVSGKPTAIPNATESSGANYNNATVTNTAVLTKTEDCGCTTDEAGNTHPIETSPASSGEGAPKGDKTQPITNEPKATTSLVTTSTPTELTDSNGVVTATLWKTITSLCTTTPGVAPSGTPGSGAQPGGKPAESGKPGQAPKPSSNPSKASPENPGSPAVESAGSSSSSQPALVNAASKASVGTLLAISGVLALML